MIGEPKTEVEQELLDAILGDDLPRFIVWPNERVLNAVTAYENEQREIQERKAAVSGDYFNGRNVGEV